MGGERNQIEIDGKQDQLDRHQDDDDVLAVEEDTENAEGEQDRRNRQIMAKANSHDRPCPGRTCLISMALSLRRPICSEARWRLTFGRWRSVSTMPPIIATKSTTPAA